MNHGRIPAMFVYHITPLTSYLQQRMFSPHGCIIFAMFTQNFCQLAQLCCDQVDPYALFFSGHFYKITREYIIKFIFCLSVCSLKRSVINLATRKTRDSATSNAKIAKR